MIFIDCGFYAGVALQKYIDKGLVDETWDIIAFEPNPELNFDYPLDVIPLKQAVWTEDGEVTFQIGGRNDAASIKGTSGHGEPRLIKVESIDFSKFVSTLPDTFIVCSMDIEGAEFPVLEKMLTNDTIGKISLLDIEFHHRLMSDKTPEDAQKLIDQLITKTAVKLKVDLN